MACGSLPGRRASARRSIASLSVRVKKLKPGAAGKTILPRNVEIFGVSDEEAPNETDEASSCMDSEQNKDETSTSMDHCSKDHVQYQVRHKFIHFGADVDTRSVKTW